MYSYQDPFRFHSTLKTFLKSAPLAAPPTTKNLTDNYFWNRDLVKNTKTDFKFKATYLKLSYFN